MTAAICLASLSHSGQPFSTEQEAVLRDAQANEELQSRLIGLADELVLCSNAQETLDCIERHSEPARIIIKVYQDALGNVGPADIL
jgi:uncharacterized protein YigA (DUF484 family)